MGSKSPQTTTTTSSPPPDVLAQYNKVTAQANQVAQTPYQAYSGQLVAGLNNQQNAGIGGVNNYANAAQPYLSGAAGLTLAGAGQANAQQFSGQALNQYLSPYQSQVVNATQAELQNQNAQQAQQLQGNLVSSGAFGGDRAGIAQAALAGQQSLANSATIANLNNQNYTQALGEFNNQQQTGLSAQQANLARLTSAGAQLGNLGTTAQSAGLQGASAQLQAGGLQQTTSQAQDTAAYNQFLQQQAYPFQTTQYLANISEGIGSNSGGTSSSSQSAPSALSGVLGAGLSLASGFSHGGRIRRDAGGLIPYDMGSVQSWVPVSGTSMLGHGPPTAQAPSQSGGGGGVGTGASGQQMLNSGLKSFGGSLANSGIGDAVSDFAQDLPDTLAMMAMARGGRVGYDDGGSVYGDLDPTLFSPDGTPLPPVRPMGLVPATAVQGTLANYRARQFDPNQPVATDSSYGEPIARGIVAPTDLRFQDRVQDLQQDASDAGIGNLMVSGYRTPEKQAALYAAYRNGTGGMAAPPGLSYHNYGDAADIVTSDPSQQSALTAMASEPWRGITPGATFGDYDHYQIAGDRPSGVAAMASAAPSAGLVPASAAAFDQTRGSIASASPAMAAIDQAQAPPSAPPSSPAPSPAAQSAAPQSSGGLLGWHIPDAIRAGMLSAGLGIMASPSRNVAMAIGQGGLQGVNTYMQAQNMQREQGLANAQIGNLNSETANRPQQLALERDKFNLQSQAVARQIAAAQAAAGIAPTSDPASLSPSVAPKPVASVPAKSNAAAGSSAAAPAAASAPAAPGSPSAAASLPDINDPFWTGVDRDENPASLMPRSRQALAYGNTELYSQMQNKANAILQRGTVLKGGQLVPIPGAQNTEAAKAAAVTSAQESAKVPANIATQTAIKNYEQQSKFKNDAADEAETGQQMLSQALGMRSIMFDPKTGQPTINSGPYGEHLASIAATMKQAGFSDNIINSLTHTDPSNAQELEKLRTSLGSESARADLAGSQVRVGEFQRYLAAVPNSQLLPAAYKYIIDNVMVPKAQQQIQQYEAVKGMDPTKDDVRGALFDYRQNHPWYAGAPPSSTEDRVKGVIYQNASGGRARWSGTGWTPIQ